MIPTGAQDPNLKKTACFFQVLPPWQRPFNLNLCFRGYNPNNNISTWANILRQWFGGLFFMEGGGGEGLFSELPLSHDAVYRLFQSKKNSWQSVNQKLAYVFTRYFLTYLIAEHGRWLKYCFILFLKTNTFISLTANYKINSSRNNYKICMKPITKIHVVQNLKITKTWEYLNGCIKNESCTITIWSLKIFQF